MARIDLPDYKGFKISFDDMMREFRATKVQDGEVELYVKQDSMQQLTEAIDRKLAREGKRKGNVIKALNVSRDGRVTTGRVTSFNLDDRSFRFSNDNYKKEQGLTRSASEKVRIWGQEGVTGYYLDTPSNRAIYDKIVSIKKQIDELKATRIALRDSMTDNINWDYFEKLEKGGSE